ncbi:MAG: NCS2 family permease [Kiritimatiellae bacterium]|nr:NCS2 family permease [Kiritimatiellia bacterium]
MSEAGPENVLGRFFRLRENGTTAKTEVLAGVTTFLTMAYIIFLQPAILSGVFFDPPIATGMDFKSVMTATCLAAALATAVMALYARYPIAQAPGMGENFLFVLSVIPAAAGAGFQNGWQVALGVVFISGLLFLLLSVLGTREAIINSISPSMKNGMAVGIGLFIAFIGLQNAGLIQTAAVIIPTDGGPVLSPGTLVKLNAHFVSIDLLVFFFGLLLTAVLHVRRVRGSILWGILATTLLCVALALMLEAAPALKQSHLMAGSKLVRLFRLATGVVSLPALAPTFFKMDLAAAVSMTMIPFIVIFLFMDVFDTIGTLVGVSEQAGFLKDNKLPRANRALLSDAVGTVTGACLGTSTVTSFIESAAGVEQGGRTGLTGLTVAALFLLSVFFSPIIAMVGSYPSITAPALVLVGAMMLVNVRKIDWDDYSECIPAFLTMVGIPLTYSIADGLALGFISYPLIKLLSGRAREARWFNYVIAAILLVYFVFVRPRY